MAQIIEVGSVFIKDNTSLPKSLKLETEPYFKGWSRITNMTSAALDRSVSAVGWTFLFMAGEVSAMAFGSNAAKTTRRAIGKVIANMKSGRFNSLEISRLRVRSFLGLPYVRVDGHLRRIQESVYLFHTKDVLGWVQSPPMAA